MAGGWLWLNLALIPTALIYLASLACERISCSPARGILVDATATVLAIAVSASLRGCGPGSLRRRAAVQIPPCPRVHCCAYISREVFLSPVRVGQVSCVLPLCLIAPRSILCGPRVMGMGV